uniref:Uncharacterized protein n=1 Tax=Leptobrachium leishanense TaxID=445787 RepID=A0A8C5WCR6_9ANUR
MTSQRPRGGGGEDLTDPPAPKKSKTGVRVNYHPFVPIPVKSFKNHEAALIYLYNTQDEGLVRKTMSDMPELKIVGPCTDQELLAKALSYCLAKSNSIHRIIFDTCTISPETEELLSQGFQKCSELRIQHCRLTSICLDLLHSAVTNRTLITLNVSQSALSYKGVKNLCAGLGNQDCVVQELRLEHCDMTSFYFEELGSAITKNRSLVILDLSHNDPQDSGMKGLCEGLRDPLCNLKELRLRCCNLTSSCCDELHSVITNQYLLKLDLSLNDLQDSGVQLLCEGLRHRDCVLQKLRLERCGLTSSCCEDLLSVITTNQSLITLDLSRNNLQDSEVKRLYEGLRDPDCVLQELRLWDCCQTPFNKVDLLSSFITNRSLTTLDLSYKRRKNKTLKRLFVSLDRPDCVFQELRFCNCGLTSSSCVDLCSVIGTSRSLIKLDLSWNKLEDLGVKRLCEGLRGCILQELWLEHCDLTSSCCEDLYSVMINLPSLITLDLSHNNLRDSGVKRLSDGLWDPGCVLQELRLERCGLTSSCCEGLRYGITNRFLIKLDLSRNKLEDSGVERLCDGLRDPVCHLQELRLERCGLTSSCCEDLLSVITTNQSLITLDLSRNNLQVSGVKRLYEGLRDPDCVLQELRLWDCCQTPFNKVDLLSSFITNRSLTTLDLSYKRLGNKILHRLCVSLNRPDCVLQELRLQHCGLTSSSCLDLRSLIATSCSLIKLDLSWNKLEDFGVMLLCEGLRHHHCILQELRLEHCDLTSSCCEDLRSVMMRHHSLIILDLSHNKLRDSGLMSLCGGLWFPGCVLRELRYLLFTDNSIKPQLMC